MVAIQRVVLRGYLVSSSVYFRKIIEKSRKMHFFVKISSKKFGGKEKMSTFAIPNENNTFETQILVP